MAPGATIKAVLCVLWLLPFSSKDDGQELKDVAASFNIEYQKLAIPEFTLDYREYFNSIGTITAVERQHEFFTKYKSILRKINCSTVDSALYQHLDYEIAMGLTRTSLERSWLKNGAIMPGGGLYSLDDSNKQWYRFFVKKFCGMDIDPADIISVGRSEVERIKSILAKLSCEDTLSYRNAAEIKAHFEMVDSAARKNIYRLFPDIDLPKIYAMQWPDAGAFTPPGIYLNKEASGYPSDVFQFNFYNQVYLVRNIDWLYMHEAIPGHHLQSSYRETLKPASFQGHFNYPGTYEGWACYVEYLGKEIGLMRDTLQQAGHLKWELIRSVRLILDAGIHYYGWDKRSCEKLWKELLPGDLHYLAEREITRVTNWPAQALSYKIGAKKLTELREIAQSRGMSMKGFHKFILDHSYYPLEVITREFKRLN